MSKHAPITWHHGLVARWWAEFNLATQDELDFYKACIRRFGEPALDLGCGTGRLLLPLLADGFDVDGIDLSEDMLEYAREGAARHGRQPTLLRQAMHELEPPRPYRTIFICDSFGIGGRTEDDRTALARIREALEPGGAMVFSHDLPHADARQWGYWLPERRRDLPLPWTSSGDRRILPDGDELELTGRLVDVDPRSQVVTMQLRPRLWRDGAVAAEEEHTIRISMYFERELRRMLADAGFASAEVQVAYSGAAPGPDDTSLVFIAERGD